MLSCYHPSHRKRLVLFSACDQFMMMCDAVPFCTLDSVMGFALHAADGQW